MENKIFIKGDIVAICPVCGLHIPITIDDIINEREILCPGGKFTAHPNEHSNCNPSYCSTKECKPKYDFHKFKLEKSSVKAINEVSL